MDIMDAIKKIAPITRYYMGGIFFMSFCLTYKILSPYSVLLDFEALFRRFQVLSGFGINQLF
jgi:hypothetical protein